MVTRNPARRLTKDDWAKAALRVLARGGIEAVAVEPIAATLGATKGSFYWHFKNRAALVEAALELWERSRTDAVIERLEQEADPATRLKLLIEGAYERGPSDRVELALLANPGHPTAVRTMRRVVERRVEYVAGQLGELGWDRQSARDRAILLAYVYAGRLQTAHLAPGSGDAGERRRQVRLLTETLVGGPPG
jgi:AcrR family transcriptional regulator